MAVRYRRTLAWVPLVVGVVGCVVGVAGLVSGALAPRLVDVDVVVAAGRLLVGLGLLLIVYGTLTLLRPFFRVQPGRVVVATVAGCLHREFPFTTLETDGSRLFAVDADGSRKQVPVVRSMAHRPDWDAVAAGARPVDR